MKKSRLKYVSRLALMITVVGMIIMVACEGPSGPEGPRGPQGEVGAVGPAGEDGSVMHAGEGEPAAEVGSPGDFYLNQNTAELYGPKTESSGWGAAISLKGPPGNDGADGADGKDGTDGEDGSQIYSGTSAPSTDQGQPGDYYLHTTTFDLYGPKTEANGWGNPINLKGTANVIYSSWIDIEWTLQDDPGFKSMAIPESRITDEFISSGTIKMYIKRELSNADGSATIITALPLPGFRSVIYFGAIKTEDQPSPNLPPNFAGLILNEDLESGAMTNTDEFEVRYVLIPGGVAASSNLSKEQISQMSYEEVMQRFGIGN